MNKISVVIPCLNVEDYIEEAIVSCITQTAPPIEIIVVDNGSTDNTQEVVQKLKKYHPHLIHILSCEKKGASAARNMGLAVTKGNWIQFLDADDILLLNKLERQKALITEDCPMVIGTSIYQMLDKSTSTIYPNKDVWKGTFEGEYAGNTTANLWSKKYLEKVGGWNESLMNTQDYDLIFRILKTNEKVVFSMEEDSVHRDREFGQISQMKGKGNSLRALNLRLVMNRWLKANKPIYYKKNQEFFEQMLYTFMINLGQKDKELAIFFFEGTFPQGIVLIKKDDYYHTDYLVKMHNLFGFSKTLDLLASARGFRKLFRKLKNFPKI